MAVRAGRLHANKGYWRDGLYPFPRSTRRFFFSSWRQVSMAHHPCCNRPFSFGSFSDNRLRYLCRLSTRTNAPRTSQNRPGEPSRPSVHPAGRPVEMSSSSHSNESAREVVSMGASSRNVLDHRRPQFGKLARRNQHPPFERANRFVVGLDRSVQSGADRCDMSCEKPQAVVQILCRVR